MKIGINASFINLPTGIGTYVFNLIKNLQKISCSEHEFHFYLSQGSVVDNFFDTSINKVHAYNIPQFNSLRKVLWEQLVLPREVMKSQLDVFHCPAFISPINLKIPSVVSFHDLGFIRYPENTTFHKRIFYKMAMKKSIKDAKHIIVPSEFTKREILSFYDCDEQKISVIHFGVDKLFSPVTDGEIINHIKYEFSITAPFFLFVGVMSPRKNLARIVEAFSRLRDKEVKLVIAGEKGWQYDEVFKKIREYKLEKRIIFTGKVSIEQLKILYCACTALVFTTLYEGFGLPLIEAMACGAPIITSNGSALSEIGRGACELADPFSPDDIAEKMEKVFYDSDLRIKMSEKGLKLAKEFTWEKCAEKTLKVYQEI